MPQGQTLSRQRRNRYAAIGAAISAVILGAGAVWILGGQDDVLPSQSTSDPVLLWLHAPRDMGTLPARSEWCSLGRSAEHCWLLQESASPAVDTGTATAMNLVNSGSPRFGVSTGIPHVDTDPTMVGEKAVWFSSGSNTLLKAGGSDATLAENNSLTFVYYIPQPIGTIDYIALYRNSATPRGIWAFRSATNTIYTTYYGASGTGTFESTAAIPGGWNCLTIAYNSTAGITLFNNGAIVAITGGAAKGSMAISSVNQVVMGPYTGYSGVGAFARIRHDQAALTLSQHQAICGTLWQNPSSGATKLAATDISYTQTGGARCFQAGAHNAICVPGGKLPVAYSPELLDAGYSPYGWAIEPGRTNRVLYSTAIDCTNWTCTGTPTIAAAVAPDGSYQATSITTTDASAIRTSSASYGNSKALFTNVWAKCDSGKLIWKNSGATGQWSIDCATIAGEWEHLTKDHAAVTVDTAFVSSATGTATPMFTSDATGVIAEVWAPTLTEVPGVSVIPTYSAAVATGDPVWQIANTGGTKYYRSARGQIDWKGILSFGTLSGQYGMFFVKPTGGAWPKDINYINTLQSWDIYNSNGALASSKSISPWIYPIADHTIKWNSTIGSVYWSIGGLEKYNATITPWSGGNNATIISLQNTSGSLGGAILQTFKIWSKPQ